MTWKEKKALENKKVVSLGGKVRWTVLLLFHRHNFIDIILHLVLNEELSVFIVPGLKLYI